MSLNWNFQRGGGFKPKKPLGGSMAIFWNNTIKIKSYPLTGMLFCLATSQTASNLCRLSDMEQFIFFL